MRVALIYNAMVTCYRYGQSREIDSAHCQPCEYYDGHRQGGVACKEGDVVDDITIPGWRQVSVRPKIGSGLYGQKVNGKWYIPDKGTASLQALIDDGGAK